MIPRKLALTIAWHPDPHRVGEVAEFLPETDCGIDLARHTPEFAQPGKQNRRPLGDGFLSRQPIRLTPTAADGLRIDFEGVKILLEVNGVPVLGIRELDAEEIEAGVVLLWNERVLLVLHWQMPVARHPPHFGMVGESAAMVRARQQIERLASKNHTVLIRGESGTGKELIAKALHFGGRRKSETFLAINIAVIPPELAASELFGCRKGAYTGAVERTGYFRDAHRGTLFLDEIGEISPEVQVRLLRVLEEGEVQAVGGRRPVRVDVRVVVATDRNLEAAVRQQQFREPLLFRLAERLIELPPLRERREDIGRLLYHFLLQELKADEGWRLYGDVDHRPWWIPARVVACFLLNSWPGNVRQVRNLVSSMVEESLDLPVIAVPQELMVPQVEVKSSAVGRGGLSKTRKDPESMSCGALTRLLERCSWEVRPAARHLGVSADTVYRRMEACQIKKAGDLTLEEVNCALDKSRGDLGIASEALRVSVRGLKQRMKALGLR